MITIKEKYLYSGLEENDFRKLIRLSLRIDSSATYRARTITNTTTTYQNLVINNREATLISIYKCSDNIVFYTYIL